MLLILVIFFQEVLELWLEDLWSYNFSITKNKVDSLFFAFAYEIILVFQNTNIAHRPKSISAEDSEKISRFQCLFHNLQLVDTRRGKTNFQYLWISK